MRARTFLATAIAASLLSGMPLFAQNGEVDAALDAVRRAMRAAGATLVDDVVVAADLSEDDLLAALRTIGAGVFPAEVAEYFARYGFNRGPIEQAPAALKASAELQREINAAELKAKLEDIVQTLAAHHSGK